MLIFQGVNVFNDFPKKRNISSFLFVRYVFLFGINKNSLINKNAPAKSIQNPTTSRWCHYAPYKCSYSSITYNPYQKMAENFRVIQLSVLFHPKIKWSFCWEPLITSISSVGRLGSPLLDPEPKHQSLARNAGTKHDIRFSQLHFSGLRQCLQRKKWGPKNY